MRSRHTIRHLQMHSLCTMFNTRSSELLNVSCWVFYPSPVYTSLYSNVFEHSVNSFYHCPSHRTRPWACSKTLGMLSISPCTPTSVVISTFHGNSSKPATEKNEPSLWPFQAPATVSIVLATPSATNSQDNSRSFCRVFRRAPF